MYSGGQRISLGNQTQSRLCRAIGRQQSCARQGKRMGHHRGLRAGHAFRGVIRELGRASRLLGSNSRNPGDRHKQHPGDYRMTWAVIEPNLAQAGRDTKNRASTQGTGREPKANQPERTKAVVATRSTAGPGAAGHLARRRGELRPKGPTIKAVRRREGEAGHDLWTRERQERLERTNCLNETRPDCIRGQQRVMRLGGQPPWVTGREAGADEPYEGILHVRICGGRRG
jgi:hypothetical protein